MSKTDIEWCDDSINPVKGLCPVACPYCYARRLYKRFHLLKDGTPNPAWDYTIRYAQNWMDDLPSVLHPSKIFVGSTMELFGNWVKPIWIQDIIQVASANPWHTFIFLTKRPENLPKAWPDNCWVGVSAVHRLAFWNGCHYLSQIKAPVKFFSFEPIQESMQGAAAENAIEYHLNNAGVNWVICGQQTPLNKKTEPKIEWIKEIVQAADKIKAPVFLKDNLKPLLASTIDGHDVIESHQLWAFKYFKLRQEFPNA